MDIGPLEQDKGKSGIDPLAWIRKHEVNGVCEIGLDVYDALLTCPDMNFTSMLISWVTSGHIGFPEFTVDGWIKVVPALGKEK